MAIGTPTLLAADSDGTDSATYATGTIAPAAGDLLIAHLTTGATNGQSAPSNAVDGLGLAWTILHTVTSNNGNLSTTVAVARADGTAGSITFSAPQANENAIWMVVAITSAQVRQSASEGAAGSDYNIELPNQVDPASTTLALAALNSGSAAIDPDGAAWTEFSTEPVVTSPVIKLQGMYGAAQQGANWVTNTNNKTYTILELGEASTPAELTATTARTLTGTATITTPAIPPAEITATTSTVRTGTAAVTAPAIPPATLAATTHRALAGTATLSAPAVPPAQLQALAVMTREGSATVETPSIPPTELTATTARTLTGSATLTAPAIEPAHLTAAATRQLTGSAALVAPAIAPALITATTTTVRVGIAHLVSITARDLTIMIGPPRPTSTLAVTDPRPRLLALADPASAALTIGTPRR